MVRRILERIAAPIRGLHQAAYLLAGLTLASQILALMRDRIFASAFGAGHTLDLYYAAFRIPDLVFALVASLVSAYVLIPRISGMDRNEARALLSESATFLICVGGALSIVLCLFMPQFLTALYPNLAAPVDRQAFVFISRLLLVQPILLGVSGILGSVTQVHRKFIIFALSPVLYNLGIIFGAVALYPVFGLEGIGFGVIIGSVAYLMVNVPVVISAGIMPRFKLPTIARMMSVVRDSVPRSLALGMGSITSLALVSLASRVGSGAISVFTFASNLESVPLALIGSSYAVAAFPALSEASASENHSEFKNILSASAKHIILWSLVALGLIVVLRAHLVRVILGAGAFNWDNTRLTAALLAILAIGLVAQGLVLLFSRALYAARQSWRPLAYQIAGGIVSVTIAVFLLSSDSIGFQAFMASLMRVGDVPGSAILLVALAATGGQVFLAILSLIALRGVCPGLASALSRPLVDGILAAVSGGAVAYAVLYLEGGIATLTTLAAVFTQGSIAGLVGLVASGCVLWIIGNNEFTTMIIALKKLLRGKIERADVLKPSAE